VSDADALGELPLTERVAAVALALGFDLVGVARAEPGAHAGFLREWLDRGYGGEMAWLARNAERRADPREVLPGARSVIALGLVYDPGTWPEPAPGAFRVARYAGGDDYHDVLLDRVRALEAALPALANAPVRTRGYVDTGPVLERAFAAGAGLGWIGKNTLLIHPRLGSYLFLGVVLTDLALEPGATEPDHCGSCRACLDACPTGAFPEPYVLDATRCLSYTTIELRGAIPEPLRAPHGDWGFGCDVCQEVCPWNQRGRRAVPADRLGLRARLAPRDEWRAPALEWVLDLSLEEWRAATRGTALRRTGYRGLLRNALVAAGNSGDASLVPLVRRHVDGGDALLAEHARWALARLSDGGLRDR
jgi:epoxyqueuosine reductase